MRLRSRLAPLVAAGALAGCGIGGGSDESDKRAVALECLQNEKNLDARTVGDNAIQVGDPRTGPRIQFYLTNGEAEAAQFSGKAEGTEHIGTALLFVRQAPDDLLKEVEACLDELS